MKLPALLICLVVSSALFFSCKSNTSPVDTKASITFSIDTLNFGTVAIGNPKNLILQIKNTGADVTIKTITANSTYSPYTISGIPATISQSAQQTITVTLTGVTAGAYFEQFNVTTDEGSVFHFYAKDTVAAGGTGNDPVVYSFVVFGCNRVDKIDFNPATNPSSANLAQLNRTFADAAALNPKPDFIFAMGDIVLGESDSITLAKQLLGWKDVYEASPAKAAGIELVAVPGNHETEDASKNPQKFGEQAWLNIMAPYITRGGNGPFPHTGDPDGLLSDQSKLTYSFNFKDAHFVVMSTDPAGLGSHPPGNWIASDITSAHANPAVKHIFAIGHKPAYSYDGSAGNGLGAVQANRDLLWSALDNSKAEGMFAAHNHTYKAFRPSGKSWMVIAGNGGSSLETGAPLFFGFTLVQVLKSGTVIQKEYGRNFGSKYIDPSPIATYPTTLRDSNVISW